MAAVTKKLSSISLSGYPAASSVVLAATFFLLPAPAAAAGQFSGADTAFIMICSALVMLMTPAGLALFYGGLTQRKSVLNTVGMSYVAFCAAILAWVVIGYSVAFGSANAWWGGLEHVLLAGIGVDDLAGTIPTTIFVLFQGCFAAIAVAIVSGSIIERVRFSTWLLFAVLWVVLCYAPIAHWIWGGGLFASHDELDFAGGTVVHISSGVSGLVLALLLGRAAGRAGQGLPAVLDQVHPAGLGPAVVRMVRLQRRLGAGGRQDCRQRDAGHRDCRRLRRPGLAVLRLDCQLPQVAVRGSPPEW